MGKPVLYLSGPMSGHADFNFRAFNSTADELRKAGYPVLNPADFGADPKYSWAECLHRDLMVMGYADIVVLLDGHESSKGASLERDVAARLGKPTIPIGEFLAGSWQGETEEEFLDAIDDAALNATHRSPFASTP